MADQDATLVVRVLTFHFVIFTSQVTCHDSLALTPAVHAITKWLFGMSLSLTCWIIYLLWLY